MPSHPPRTACPRIQGAQRFCLVERGIRSPELQARRASPRPWPAPAACWQTRRPLRRPVFNRTSRFSERQQQAVRSWHGTPRHDGHSAFRASPKLETAMNAPPFTGRLRGSIYSLVSERCGTCRTLPQRVSSSGAWPADAAAPFAPVLHRPAITCSLYSTCRERAQTHSESRNFKILETISQRLALQRPAIACLSGFTWAFIGKHEVESAQCRMTGCRMECWCGRLQQTARKHIREWHFPPTPQLRTTCLSSSTGAALQQGGSGGSRGHPWSIPEPWASQFIKIATRAVGRAPCAGLTSGWHWAE